MQLMVPNESRHFKQPNFHHGEEEEAEEEDEKEEREETVDEVEGYWRVYKDPLL